MSNITLRHWPAAQPNPTLPPLLLVPGAFNSLKLWEDRFAPAWAAAGLDTWAMDFRSDQAGPLRRHALGLRDFCEDLSDAIAGLPRPPVVLGYSLGGRVTLELAAQATLPGMVLLNALPGRGVPEVILNYARQEPISLGKFLCLAVASPVRRLSRRLPAGIASAQSDGPLTASFVEGLRGESLRALAESLFPASPIPSQIPALVIGMSGDRLIPPSVAQGLAAELNAELLLLEGLSHTPMIEPAGAQVINAVTAWVKGLATPSSP